MIHWNWDTDENCGVKFVFQLQTQLNYRRTCEEVEKMAEKDNGRYRYEPYQPLASSKTNNGSNTLKRMEATSSLKAGPSGSKAGITGKDRGGPQKRCCNCMGPKATSFWVGLITNLGICALLLGYTLLGAFIFLSIEGAASTMHQRTLASTNRQLQRTQSSRMMDNVTLSDSAMAEAMEARQKTVENIWEITVSLNILYRENWTR